MRLTEGFQKRVVTLLSPPVTLLSGLADHPDDHQQRDRPDHRADEAGALPRRVPVQGLADESGEERAADAQRNGEDDAHLVVARMQPAPEQADDEADDQGADEAEHGALLVFGDGWLGARPRRAFILR